VTRDFDLLLDVTIDHLQQLKESGVQYLDINTEKLAGLLNTRTGVRSRQAPSSPRPSPPVEEREKSRSEGGSRTGLPLPVNRPLTPALSPDGGEGEHTGSAMQAEIQPAMSKEAKAQGIAELRERAMQCMKCAHLASSRKNVVFGVGSVDADLIFVGEAPGADEDAAGEPFVGKAGQLLTKIIQTMGLTRDDVYIANILKCRPDTPGQSAGNRKPTPDEMQTCIPYLHAQIDLIQPKVLVALGATAVEGLLGKTEGITRLRGNWKTYRGIPLMPTYHPAYLLRNQALSEKRRVWEDMLQVMERLGMPISERQRNFFL
jgi:uracil-DNA glycosylase